MRKPKVQRQSGFSLMEVLVALAILAIAMAGLIKVAGGSSANLAYLENKTIAHWVAMNQIAAARVAEQKPQMGMLQGEETMAGRDWGWSIDISETPDLDVLRLDVEVRRSDEDDEIVYATLTGYAAR
ncbi:MAG: type II secretion system minor pseudopilin GspI [Anaerolineae bacterium]|nr:type II secretion system minor pseudopilin GspI [Anaerolineae bacterium]